MLTRGLLKACGECEYRITFSEIHCNLLCKQSNINNGFNICKTGKNNKIIFMRLFYCCCMICR